MINKKRIRRRKYRTKRELAMAYSPGATEETASQTLLRWINGCPPLLKSLMTIGYKKRGNKLRQEEVNLIIKYLGRPYGN